MDNFCFQVWREGRDNRYLKLEFCIRVERQSVILVKLWLGSSVLGVSIGIIGLKKV